VTPTSQTTAPATPAVDNTARKDMSFLETNLLQFNEKHKNQNPYPMPILGTTPIPSHAAIRYPIHATRP
jgi:hypothetical protein